MNPATLTLLDRYENGLHAVMLELSSHRSDFQIESVIGDATDEQRMAAVMAEWRPALVFHAAAHKHVPLMELNPCEAVKNNVKGTRVLADTARHFGVDRLILISTDKAVNPSSVMGATKRVAELLVQGLNGHGQGVFAAVRFGNVLASNGSVLQTFLDQIKAGGPVTVTHPEMQRYFMLIREAVHLVLQAERLSEELVGKDESAEPSSVEGILRIVSGNLPEAATFRRRVADLERTAEAGDTRSVIEQLRGLVQTYEPPGGTDG
jgi:FlaA1/EpsC-like NDP-sugar epimerase